MNQVNFDPLRVIQTNFEIGPMISEEKIFGITILPTDGQTE
jgi:hypothetical protein